MAENSTLARPYAEAVFRIADANDKLADWSGTLSALAQVVGAPAIAAAIRDPNLSASKVAGTVIHVLAGRLTAESENLVRVLAENRRLELLADISDQYEALRNAREGIVEAQIVSAFPLDDAQLADVVSRLEKRTGKRIKPAVSIDNELIAGIRVVIGDKVIDGSARAQLTALEAALKQ